MGLKAWQRGGQRASREATLPIDAMLLTTTQFTERQDKHQTPRREFTAGKEKDQHQAEPVYAAELSGHQGGRRPCLKVRGNNRAIGDEAVNNLVDPCRWTGKCAVLVGTSKD